MNRHLAENTSYVNVQPAGRWTALHHAAANGHLGVAKVLLSPPRRQGGGGGESWEHKLRALHEAAPIDCYQLSGTTVDGKPVTNGTWCTADAARHVLGGAPAALERFFAREQAEAAERLV